MQKPILTISQYLDAIFSNKYDEEKIKEIKSFIQSEKQSKSRKYKN